MTANTRTEALIPAEELELHIQNCNHLMELAMEQGRRQDAVEWMQARDAAIKARSPATVQRMEQDLMQRIYQPCYFDTMGELHRQQLPFFLRPQAA